MHVLNSVRRLLASKGISKLAGAAQDLTLFLIILNYVSCTSHVHPLLVNLLIQIECIVFAFNRDLSYIGDSCSVLSIIGKVIERTMSKCIWRKMHDNLERHHDYCWWKFGYSRSSFDEIFSQFKSYVYYRSFDRLVYWICDNKCFYWAYKLN